MTGGQAVDAEALFAAIRDPAVLYTDDPRTQLLVRDAVLGLRHFWGESGLAGRLRRSPQRAAIERFLTTSTDEIGFPTLQGRIMNVTDTTTLMMLCRNLGSRLREPATITIGGSLALTVASLVSRSTEDIDVVEELPLAVRREQTLVDDLVHRYGLRLTHFQYHYLPDGWQVRTQSVGVFRRLTVHAIDPIDVLTGKLFSRRTKDLGDLRAAWPKIDHDTLRQASPAALRCSAPCPRPSRRRSTTGMC